ncbi:MAG TPA: HAMP domain-containing protein, partial [Rhodothermales bacterium]
SGVWKDLTDNVNFMASNLTSQVRNIAEVTTAVATGDLSKKITVDVKGEILSLKNTINTMVDQLSSFASEVTRVAREVGTEGELGGQAEVEGVSGVWKDLTDNVNNMASNLTSQVRNIAEVTTAVANGDLSKKITVDVKGEIEELKNTINTMVDQLSSFASEVTRVAREVGTEGELGGQAEVKGVSGTWKDLTDNVNSMASNLTTQVRAIAEVTTAVANGDLSKKISVSAKGEILELKNTINTMVDQLSSFASEVTRVAREVGTEGALGGQAEVKGVSGTWKDLTDNVNFMASNLTTQVRAIAEVTTAVANGDLSKKITVDVKGEIEELKNTINTMVDQLSSFADEVTRVAREVGTEGKLGGQAIVEGVSGVWEDLTDNVNNMANNLTTQVRAIAEVTTAVANGDLSKKITVDVKGEIEELKNTINTMVDQLSSFADEVTRVAREVGTEGRLGGQAEVKGVSGTWKDLTDNVNSMASNLTTQVRAIAEVTTAVANGDLSKKITVDVKGEIEELKNTINTMVDQLSSFASEVTRVAREVGTDGKLGGQAEVRGVSGTWKDLTDNVNNMANNLTTQVRGIARVVTSVARGDLKRKLSVEAKGEIAELADTINGMIDTLATFADQVTTVAREVGIEGKLGGQANVPGASGTWRDLTDNVNRLAANLTTQVRAITEVTTAVASGDLSKRITVDAAGEVADLKNNVNEMIRNLKDTTRKNAEQDWLKTNLTRFTQLLQGQKELLPVAKLILSEISPLVNAQHGVFYLAESAEESEPVLQLLASYAYRERKGLNNAFRLGEGLVGQCALERERILVRDVPDSYIRINSGLGEAAPRNIIVLPVVFEGQVKAVVELASFHDFSPIHLTFLDQLTESIGIVLNTIEANMRTEMLLKQSQSLTQELQAQQDELTETNRRLEQQARSLRQSEELLKEQQEELQQTNVELEQKAKLLAEQKAEVERKNREIELARKALEEKAEQLALTSKYKSEFLANMSHELRTPLNSMLILSKMLSENKEGNLSTKQTEFAETIYSSGADLLGLINEILDLSKIESGAMGVEVESIELQTVVEDVERMFRQIAHEKGLAFDVSIGANTPQTIATDVKRLEQVLRNLLSNAFKFTDEGSVILSVSAVKEEIDFHNEVLKRAERVLAFSVADTGIGIPEDRQKVIFEAFQQADGTTSRDYGGTGLGLSISREIARLLGGEIHLQSARGEGSVFTLFLPAEYIPTSIGAADDEAEHTRTEGYQLVSTGSSAATIGARPRKSTAESNGSDVGVPADAPVERKEPVHSSGDGAEAARRAEPQLVRTIRDDRDDLRPGDRVLMIVEDDLNFAGILMNMAHDKGFKCIIAPHGEAAFALAKKYPLDAITLDIQLPGMHGLTLLDRLKNEPRTRHIPVHIVSVAEELPRSRRKGALAQLRKPATEADVNASIDQIRVFLERGVRKLLIIEDDAVQRERVAELSNGDDVQVTAVATAAEAIAALQDTSYDCVVLDLGLPDMSGFDLIRRIRREMNLGTLPIIVHTARDLSQQEVAELNQLAESIIVKDVQAYDRLLDETALYLHRVESALPEDKRKRLEQMHMPETRLATRRVCIIDDDIRNIFALTSLLERHGMDVIYAENGEDGIELLKNTPGVDAVLMDVMMP